MRIASRFGGEAQEIVLRSGSSQDGGTKSQGDNSVEVVNSESDSSAGCVAGPSNQSSSVSSALRNVAQIIAAGK